MPRASFVLLTAGLLAIGLTALPRAERDRSAGMGQPAPQAVAPRVAALKAIVDADVLPRRCSIWASE
ncbi:MAG: hypothetical protein R2708_01110 [Vicinamibacterales bacterium]